MACRLWVVVRRSSALFVTALTCVCSLTSTVAWAQLPTDPAAAGQVSAAKLKASYLKAHPALTSRLSRKGGPTSDLRVSSVLSAARDSPTAAQDAPFSSDDLTAPTLALAKALAKAQGRRVEVDALMQALTTTFANPDGTLTEHEFTAPVRVRQGGRWLPIDTTLVPWAGRLRSAAVVGDVTFGEGGDTALVRQSLPDGGVCGFDWSGPLPTPVVQGDTATYPGVVEHGDLVVTAKKLGFELSIVLHARPTSPVGVDLPVVLPAGDVLVRANGGWNLNDAQGTTLSVVGQTTMAGATLDPQTQAPTRSSVVADTLAGSPEQGLVLQLRPDPTFLADPGVTFPVDIDPSVSLAENQDTWISSTNTNTSYYTSKQLRVGYWSSAPTEVLRSYLSFPMGSVHGWPIDSATMNMFVIGQNTCPSLIDFTNVPTSFNSATTWANRPAADATIYAEPSWANHTCPVPSGGEYVDAPITSLVQHWSDAASTTGVMRLTAPNESSSGSGQYKEFASGDQPPGRQPYIATTFSTPPDAPTGVSATAGDATAQVSWTAPVSDGGKPISGYWVNLYTAGGTYVNQFQAPATATTTTPQTYSWPDPMTNGVGYYFRVYSINTVGFGQGTQSATFTPAGRPLAPPSVSAAANATTTSVSWGAANANGSPVEPDPL